MPRVLSILSLLAFGLLLAGILAVVLSGSGARIPSTLPSLEPGRSGGSLDHTSLLIGLAAGWLLAVIGRVPWLELPQRAIAWLFRNERNIFRAGMAAAFLAVLILY
jgi:hypothetical protein